jgi:uncharacterized protein YndB with AHSA1/START domain
MAERTDASTSIDQGVLVVERVFDAPRELVWKAWTDPHMIEKWWGPKAFTAPAVEFDFRVGGKWLFAMQSPDFNSGEPIWSTGTYREIVRFERIVFTDSFADESGTVVPATHYGMTGDFPLEMLVTVDLEDIGGGKTKLSVRHEGLPASDSEGAGIGWSESLEKMAASLT